VIYNGVVPPRKAVKSDYLDELGIEKNKYVIAVGRFLEEKGFDYLIKAFRKTSLTDYKLVLVGDTDYPTAYSNRLKDLARSNEVIMTGFIRGDKLNQVFTFAKLFIMSSYEEGLPIALLEAMSYDIDVLVSDIPANLQLGLENDDYFPTGDEDMLKEKILKKLSADKKRSFSSVLSRNFNWEKISTETNNIYQSLTN
jgi:glycosyltransferase involved in cell wall biosynthesis